MLHFPTSAHATNRRRGAIRNTAFAMSLVVAVSACGNGTESESADTDMSGAEADPVSSDPGLFCDTLVSFSIVATVAFVKMERGNQNFETVVRKGDMLLQASIEAAPTPELAASPQALVEDYQFLLDSYSSVDFDLQRFVELDSNDVNSAAGRVGLAVTSDIDPVLVDECDEDVDNLLSQRNLFAETAGFPGFDPTEIWEVSDSNFPLDLSD